MTFESFEAVKAFVEAESAANRNVMVLCSSTAQPSYRYHHLMEKRIENSPDLSEQTEAYTDLSPGGVAVKVVVDGKLRCGYDCQDNGSDSDDSTCPLFSDNEMVRRHVIKKHNLSDEDVVLLPTALARVQVAGGVDMVDRVVSDRVKAHIPMYQELDVNRLRSALDEFVWKLDKDEFATFVAAAREGMPQDMRANYDFVLDRVRADKYGLNDSAYRYRKYRVNTKYRQPSSTSEAPQSKYDLGKATQFCRRTDSVDTEDSGMSKLKKLTKKKRATSSSAASDREDKNLTQALLRETAPNPTPGQEIVESNDLENDRRYKHMVKSAYDLSGYIRQGAAAASRPIQEGDVGLQSIDKLQRALRDPDVMDGLSVSLMPESEALRAIPTDYYWIHQFQTLQNKAEENPEASMIALGELSRDFVGVSSLYARVLASERHLAPHQKSIRPVSAGGIAGGEKYCCAGIFFKFAINSDGLYDSDIAAAKVARHDLRGLNSLLNVKNKDIGCPLSCVIDYKGVSLVAVSRLPIGKKTLVYGSADGGRTVHNSDKICEKTMLEIGRRLNLEPHLVANKTMAMCGDIEVHRSVTEAGKDGDLYVLDFARIFPCEPPLESSLKASGASGKSFILTRLLRPEAVQTSSKALCSDSFSLWDDSSRMDRERHKKDVVRIYRDVIKTTIPRFARWLEQRPESDAGTVNIAELLHLQGINVRHMKAVYDNMTNEVWRMFLMTEMMARAHKELFINLLGEVVKGMVEIPIEEPYTTLFRRYGNLIVWFKEYALDGDKVWELAAAIASVKFYSGELGKISDFSSCRKNLHWGRFLERLVNMVNIVVDRESLEKTFKCQERSAISTLPFNESNVRGLGYGTHSLNLVDIGSGVQWYARARASLELSERVHCLNEAVNSFQAGRIHRSAFVLRHYYPKALCYLATDSLRILNVSVQGGSVMETLDKSLVLLKRSVFMQKSMYGDGPFSTEAESGAIVNADEQAISAGVDTGIRLEGADADWPGWCLAEVKAINVIFGNYASWGGFFIPTSLDKNDQIHDRMSQLCTMSSSLLGKSDDQALCILSHIHQQVLQGKMDHRDVSPLLLDIKSKYATSLPVRHTTFAMNLIYSLFDYEVTKLRDELAYVENELESFDYAATVNDYMNPVFGEDPFVVALCHVPLIAVFTGQGDIAEMAARTLESILHTMRSHTAKAYAFVMLSVACCLVQNLEGARGYYSRLTVMASVIEAGGREPFMKWIDGVIKMLDVCIGHGTGNGQDSSDVLEIMESCEDAWLYQIFKLALARRLNDIEPDHPGLDKLVPHVSVLEPKNKRNILWAEFALISLYREDRRLKSIYDGASLMNEKNLKFFKEFFNILNDVISVCISRECIITEIHARNIYSRNAEALRLMWLMGTLSDAGTKAEYIEQSILSVPRQKYDIHRRLEMLPEGAKIFTDRRLVESRSSPSPFIVMDSFTSQIMANNRAACTMFGMSTLDDICVEDIIVEKHWDHCQYQFSMRAQDECSIAETTAKVVIQDSNGSRIALRVWTGTTESSDCVLLELCPSPSPVLVDSVGVEVDGNGIITEITDRMRRQLNLASHDQILGEGWEALCDSTTLDEIAESTSESIVLLGKGKAARPFSIRVVECQGLKSLLCEHVTELSKEHLSGDVDMVLLRSAVDPIVCMSSDSIISFANGAAHILLGYDEDELIGMHVTEIMSESIASQHNDYVDKYLKSSQKSLIGSTRRLPARMKDGGSIEVDISLSSAKMHNKEVFLAVLRSEKTSIGNALIDSAADPMVSILIDGIIRIVNEAACALLGYKKHELLGKNVNIIMPEPYKSQHDEFLKVYRDTGIAKLLGKSRELPALTKEGKTVVVEVTLSKAVVDGQQVFVSIMRQPKESVDSALLDSAVDPMISATEDGTVRSGNRAVCQLLGYSKNELIGMNLRRLMPEPYASEHDSYLARYKATGVATLLGKSRELPALCSDGTTVIVEVTLSKAIVDGFPVFVGVLRPQKQSVDSALLDAAVDATLSITEMGIIRIANRALCELLDYSKEELVGCNINMLMPEPYSSEHDGYLEAYKKTGISTLLGKKRELPARKKDGTNVVVEITLSKAEVDGAAVFIGVLRVPRESVDGALMDASMDPTLSITEDGTIRLANIAFCDFFGYSKAQLLGSNVRMLMPEPYSSEHDSYLSRYAETGVANLLGKTRELPALKNDGTSVVVEITLSKAVVEGSPVFVGVLRPPKMSLDSALLDASYDITLSITEEGLIRVANEAACKWFGYSKEELMGANVRVLMPEPYSSEHDSYLQNYRDTGDAKLIGHTRDLPSLAKDGTVRNVEVTLSKAVVEGTPVFIGVMRPHKQSVDNALLDAARDPTISITEDGSIRFVNKALCELLGYTKKELDNTNIKTIMPEPFSSEHDSYLSNYRETGRAKLIGHTRELPALAKNGEVIVVEITLSKAMVEGVPLFIGVMRPHKQSVDNALLDAARDPTISITEDGSIRFVNKALCELLGYTKKELDNTNIKTIMPEPFSSEHDSYLSNYRETGRAKLIGHTRELPALAKNGEVIVVEITLSKAVVEGVPLFIGVMRPHKQSVDNALLDAARDPTISITEDGSIRFVNKALCELLGYTKKELDNTNIKTIMPEPFSSEHDSYLSNYRETGRAKLIGHTRELPALAKNGEVIVVEITLSKAVVEGVPLFIGVLRRVKAALDSALIDAALDPTISIDKFGKIRVMNRAALESFGYSAEETLGYNVKMLMPEPYCSQHDSYLEHYRKTGEMRLVGQLRELPILRKDGSQSTVEITVSRAIVDGEPVFIGVLREPRHDFGSSFIAGALDAMCAIRSDGTIALANDALCTLFGYSANMLLNKNIQMLMPEPYSIEHDSYIAKYMETKRERLIGRPRALPGLNASGKRFWVEIRLSHAVVGTAHMFFAVIRDL